MLYNLLHFQIIGDGDGEIAYWLDVSKWALSYS